MPLFKKIPTGLNGLFLYERSPLADQRGAFQRLYCRDTLKEFGVDRPISQINHSISEQQGTIRGLHFQHAPAMETKIITCLAGEVYDVAVDLRENSPTFLKHYGVRLGEDKPMTIVIPEGFAHGFQSLRDRSELLYLHTANYQPGSEDGIDPFDPRIGIRWPITVSQVSERDAALPALKNDFTGLRP